MSDGDFVPALRAPTRDNLSGALPSIFEKAGLAGAEQTGRLRTAFGTMALYRAERPQISA